MKSSCVVVVLLLAVSTASCRLSLAATAAGHESSASIPAILGRELRGFIARAGNMFRSAGAGSWRAAATANNATTEAKNMRAVASRRRRPTRKSGSGSGGGGCVSAAACRKRRVICAKRCYRASRAAGLTHVPSRCVVKCRKCVPTC